MALFGKQHYCPACMASVRNLNSPCPFCGFNPSERPASARYMKANTVIGERYLIGNVLSENAFSVTYVGMDLQEKKKKVIKEYCPYSCVSRTEGKGSSDNVLTVTDGKANEFRKGLDLFISGAKALKDICAAGSLAGIMNVTDAVETKGTCYMVSDFEDGEILRKTLKSDRFAGKELFELVKPIISSLEELHKNNIVHGNITPFNIMISPDRKKATLIGFSLGETAVFESMPKRGFTALEEYPSFKGSVGPWTDIFGMCTTIYYGLTGTIPPDAPDRTIDDEIESPASLGADITEDREAVIMQGMEVYERDRFKAIRALYNAIYSDEEEVVYFEEETVPEPEIVSEPAPEPVSEPVSEPAPEQEITAQAAPQPVPAASKAPAAAPAPQQKEVSAQTPGTEGYSQVIVRRSNKDYVTVNGTTYSTKLDKLDICGTNLAESDAKDLAKLENLEYLYVDGNYLASLECVASMKKLIVLSANNNFISDISMLVNLPELREISLSGNKELQDLSVFEYIRRVRKLDLSYTGVTDIKPLFYLDQLRSLDLRGTKVTSRQIKKLYSEMPNCTIKYDFKK